MVVDLLRPLSDDELLALSNRNPGLQLERSAKGALVVSPTGGESGRWSAEVHGHLWAWNAAHRDGVTFDSSTGFRLADGSCLSPDASWVRRDRWEALPRAVRRRFVPLCPEAVFEVRSESNDLTDLRRKVQAYLAHGARIAVLVDPEDASIEVHRAAGPAQRHDGVAALDPELPGFVLDLRRMG